MKKFRKLFLHTFQNIADVLGPKTKFGNFKGGGGAGGSACRSIVITQIGFKSIGTIKEAPLDLNELP